jgi:hypothetical protein
MTKIAEETSDILDEDPDLHARVQNMLDHCEIVNVRVIDFSGSRTDVDGRPTTASITSETSYFVSAEAMANRYVWDATLSNETTESVAELKATILVDYKLSEGFSPDKEAADAIAKTTGFFAAYPYVRELLQSTTTRLQLDPLVLGFLMKGEQAPRSLHQTTIHHR